MQVDAYMREALDRFGGVDIALLNAGIEGAHTPLEEYPPEVFARVLAVNVGGVWPGLRAAIQPLRRRGGGSVVITSSIQGSSALPYTSAYTTSKHANGMMKGAALELAKDNIRVNCIVPGMTDTPMMDRIHESSGAPEQMAATVRATIPMRRYARPEEIARLMSSRRRKAATAPVLPTPRTAGSSRRGRPRPIEAKIANDTIRPTYRHGS